MYKKLTPAELKKYKTQDVYVLAIESSCDETSVAVVKNGTEVICNLINSQIEIHRRFGGVVPEVASRNHLMALLPLVQEAMTKIPQNANVVVAVTNKPGLAGALMVGIAGAKALAFSLGVPLVAVNHIEGHIAGSYLVGVKPQIDPGLSTDKPLRPPFTALVVSGGHTEVVKVKSHIEFEKIITTADDAIGEAFDKVARVLGLPYPGGPEVQKRAENFKRAVGVAHICDPHPFSYTIPPADSTHFSYSGLKSAVINYVHNLKQKSVGVAVLSDPQIDEICFHFQELAFKQLTQRAVKLADKKLILCGGVAANTRLKEMMKEEAEKAGVEFHPVPFKYCTDNAAMIGAQGYFNLINNRNIATMELGNE
ncbi:MAG: tRNA (adenosine(37)-N6)-threonylcarbamoyltransferase complex transferase subunit TsaD [Firmicutes bacterium]|nr:tRNA (adenosine(37)-N6)-threonylcarbamoyltransferase complex transferase subunit TsaD [Bacillota bacterium]